MKRTFLSLFFHKPGKVFPKGHRYNHVLFKYFQPAEMAPAQSEFSTTFACYRIFKLETA